MTKTLSALAVALLLVTPAFAQGAPPAPARTQIVSANPFLLLAGWFNAEYERKISDSATWGLSGSMFDFDDFEYRSGSVLFRYYPQERALEGFYLGLRGGVIHVGYDGGDATVDDEATFGAAGFDLGYTWLLGARDRVGISIGAGANRLFGSELEGATLTVPTIRLVNVGIAF
jgi:hypothetical protein